MSDNAPTSKYINTYMTEQDLQQLASKGISEEQVNRQLENIKNGFPYLQLQAAASVGHGIVVPDEIQKKHYVELWNQYKQGNNRIVKFVPASGAASRMFKNLYAFLHADYSIPTTDFEKEIFSGIKKFAFYEDLSEACERNEGLKAMKLMANGDYKKVVENLLEPKGLNYGQLPKGLLLFHNYDDAARTPMEEHLVEAALYTGCHGESYIHFTVSHDHLALFRDRVAQVVNRFSKRYKVNFHISFSEQKPNTDTIATNMDNTPFRNSDGTLLFRPAGHGALIENLNDIEGDVIFIKNIDNVVPDRLKTDTITYKQVIGGFLIELQEKCFKYLRLLDAGKYSHDQLEEIIRFVQRDLTCRNQRLKYMEDKELIVYLKQKLNRPLRVCGVVRNVGEPGGGPFIVLGKDGATSPQILESSQIDVDNKEYVRMFEEGTHFNPVDIVCALKDYKGNAFNLSDFVDVETGFISTKSKDGKELKALELPGLWNGSMSNWNTVFVEVPLSTFNPVKTVNDLLREQHQP